MAEPAAAGIPAVQNRADAIVPPSAPNISAAATDSNYEEKYATYKKLKVQTLHMFCYVTRYFVPKGTLNVVLIAWAKHYLTILKESAKPNCDAR